MGIEENKALVRRFYELYNQQELDSAYELLSLNFQPEGKNYDIMLQNAIPNIQATILDMVAEGDKVAYMINVTGKHTGGLYFGIPSTGKKLDVKAAYIVRIVDNKIVEWEGTAAFLNNWQQLGVFPSSADFIQAYNDSMK